MAPTEESNPGSDPQLAEMRIALAMSGAIALVLYESGVAHEIHSFVKPDGPYKKAFELAALKPIVDILTGASAGGINSVLLGHCFVTGADFTKFGDVWIQKAGVDVLRYSGDEDPKSVLAVSPLTTAISQIFKENFEKLEVYKGKTALDKEIKVRLCRTDLRGFCVTTVDAAGHRIDVQSRSDVVAFDTKAFQNENTEDILLAAVATSAFPIAFPAVFDRKVGRWYVDGGLWDNQPIDLAVDAIRDKPAFGRTHRCVFFIDPDPSVLAEDDDVSLDLGTRREQLARRGKEEEAKEPSVLETATFIPGLGVKGNVLPALESILDYNRRIELYRQAIGLPFLVNHLPEIDKDISVPQTGTDAFLSLSLLEQARIYAVIFDNDPKLIQSWAHVRDHLDEKAGVDESGKVTALKQLVDGASNVLAKVGEVDILRRSLRRKLRSINDELKDEEKTKANPRNRKDDKRRVYGAIAAANGILEISLDEANDRVGTSLAFREHRREQVSRFWAASIHVLGLITKAMNEPDGERKLYPVIAKAIAFWESMIPVPDSADGKELSGHFAALEEVQKWEESVPDPENPGATKLVPVIAKTSEDRIRYVLASFSDLDGKTPIDLIRISPNDTNNLDLIGSPKSKPGQTPAGQKLAGEELGHLSGFLEERWRRNDYVWGRLDAAEILLKALLNCAKHEAKARGNLTSDFTEVEYREVLQAVQTAILQEEAERYRAHTAETIEKVGAGSGDALVIEGNKKLIGFGGEGLADEAEPPQKDNLNYVVLTLLKLMRGKTPYHQGIIKRIGSSIMDHVAIDIADKFLHRFRKKS